MKFVAALLALSLFGAAQAQDTAHGIPVHLADVAVTLDQALIAFVHGEDAEALLERCAHDSAHGRVHAGRVAAAGENC